MNFTRDASSLLLSDHLQTPCQSTKLMMTVSHHALGALSLNDQSNLRRDCLNQFGQPRILLAGLGHCKFENGDDLTVRNNWHAKGAFNFGANCRLPPRGGREQRMF